MRLGMSHRVAKTFFLPTLLSSFALRANRFRKFTHPHRLQNKLKSLAPQQFILEKEQVFPIPSAYQELLILSGIAWLTVAGQDIILTTGEKVSLDSNQGLAILSTLGDKPLILEVIG
jgi:hypothetical protein